MKRLILLSIVLPTIIFQSCVNSILTGQEFMDYKPIPVVYSLFTPDEEFEVFVLWSIDPQKPYWKQESDTIKDAKIFLYDNEKSLGELTYNEKKGCYKFIDLYNPKIGHKYSLEISIPSYDATITATSSIPEVTKVNISLDTIYGTLKDIREILPEEREQYKHNINIELPTSYKPSFIGIGLGSNGSTVPPMYNSDPKFQNNKEFYKGPILIFDDRYFEYGEIDIEYTSNLFCLKDNNYQEYYDKGQLKTFEIQVYSLSDEIYYHFSSTKDFWKGGQADSEVPIEVYHDPHIIYSNINNATGVFAGYSKSIFELKTKVE